ncbi:hypothetical protein D1007_09948 [Hordeum vulgare]|nr:hypothetical protein D1007_09948 [Hordeum vulgare]
MSTTRGACYGSDIDEVYIECTHHRHKLPLAEVVAACISGVENAPDPQDGEVVVFAKHFARVLGLSLNTFFRRLLTHYGLQPHHLSANAVLQLAAFLTLCEG